MEKGNQSRFRVNGPKIIHQAFDTEVVIVNLERGIYYSLGGSGVAVWKGIVAGASLESLVAAHRHNGNSGRVQESISGLIDQLGREELIVEDASRPAVDVSLKPEEFREPELRKYTDMQDLLLLDPIHEVDEAGWPVDGASRSA